MSCWIQITSLMTTQSTHTQSSHIHVKRNTQPTQSQYTVNAVALHHPTDSVLIQTIFSKYQCKPTETSIQLVIIDTIPIQSQQRLSIYHQPQHKISTSAMHTSLYAMPISINSLSRHNPTKFPYNFNADSAHTQHTTHTYGIHSRTNA